MLHKSLNELNIEPKEGQSELLCSNIRSCDCPSLGCEHDVLSDEAIINLIELGEYLKTICIRLLSEGYSIVDGILYPKQNAE